MKKLLLSLGLAFSLIGSTATHAQTTTEPFLLPAFAYQVKSVAGTFQDISTDANTVKLGEELADGVDLKNKIFIATSETDQTPSTKTGTGNMSATLVTPAFPLGFEFKLSGRPMTHFVVSAFGGAYFSDTPLRPDNTTAPTIGAGATNCIFAIPYIKTSQAPAGKITKKANTAPACYLISGTENNHVLTVQHDYLVNGDEWIFQFKFYEATGNIEFTAKEFKRDNMGSDYYEIALSLTETATATAATDPFGAQFLSITPLVASTQHKIFVGQNDAAKTEKGWDSIVVAANSQTRMRIDAEHSPEEGRTIALLYPAQCPEHAERYTAEHYNITGQTSTENSFSASIHFKQEMFPSAEAFTNSGTIVAVLSKDAEPQYTLTNGTWYKKGDNIGSPAAEGAFIETVLCNAQPKITISPKFQPYGYNMGKAIAISATGLEKAMQYYIHLYHMKYDCDGAPIYSELCHTLPFTTPFDMPKKLESGLPTVNSVDVSVEPADNYAVLLVKSKTLPLPTLSGLLKKGDKIGEDAEVIDLLTAAADMTLQLAENEGCYLSAYTVNTADPTRYIYAPNALTLSVRAAYPTLPGFIDFADEPYTLPDLLNPQWENIAKTTFRPLPFGWTRETEIPANACGKAFGTGKPNYDKSIPTYLYAEALDGREFDIVTPAFVCDKERVFVTYNMTQLRSENETATVKSKPDNTDTIIIEYATEENAWIRCGFFTGATLTDLNPAGYYPLECKIEEEGIKGKRMRIRYRYFGAAYEIFNAIASIDIQEAKLCDKPRAIRQTDTLTTDQRATITWTDDNYPAASSFAVFYRPAADTAAAWKKATTKTPTATLSDLTPNTTYAVYLAANCGSKFGDSHDSYPASFSTLRSFPYQEPLTQEPDYTENINGTTVKRQGFGPFNRGMTTYTGALSGNKGIILSASHAAGAVKPNTKVTLYTTAIAESGISILYNIYKTGEKVPTLFDKATATTVSESSIDIEITEEMTIHAQAQLSQDGKTFTSNTLKVKFTVNENAEDQAGERIPADLTPAAPLEAATPSDGSAFSPSASFPALDANETPTSVGIREAVKHAWLLTPVLYVEEYGLNFPQTIKFKANSAQQITQEDGTKKWIKGEMDEKYAKSKLYVLVSQNGQFTINDTLASYQIGGETVDGREFAVNLPKGIEGQVQVALYFNNPNGTDADNAPMMLFEIYDFAFEYTGTPCFPLTNLKRSNTTTDQATFSWDGNSAEYMIYWGPAASGTYTDSAKTAEKTYTLTGLKDFTQYHVKVIGYCDAEHTAVAPAELTATFSTLQECHTPLNFEVTDITTTDATFISATDQPDYMSKRLVYVTPEDGGEMQIFDQLADTLNLAGKFAKKTAYIAQTQAICGTDSSAMSEAKTFTTLDSFDVVLNVTPAESGNVTGAGRYEDGTEITITATAAQNYDFVAWMREADTLSKEAAYTFKVTADVTYTALFVKQAANEDLLKAAFHVTTDNGCLHVRNLNGIMIRDIDVYGLTGKKIGHFTLNSREDLSLPIDAGKAILLVRIATEQGVAVYKVYLH